jgi:hypothetical protein
MMFALLSLSSPLLAAGSCNNYTPDVNGTMVTCTGVGSTSVGVISAQSDTTVGNSVTVNIDSGTSLIINGSTVGIGSAATVVNNGNLNTSSFLNGYGISSGANGIQVDNNANSNRTTITNTSSGLIGAPTTANYAIYSAQQPGVDIYNYGRSARFTEAPYDVLQ